MQELNNLLSLIDAHFGGSQWFVFLLLGTGLFFTSIFGFRNCAFSGMRSRLCEGSTTISKT